MVLDFDSVEVRGVGKDFNRTVALDNISLRFQKGSVTGIEGTNGSGKSTLLAILAGHLKPSRGTIVYGENATSEHPDVRRQIGWLGHSAMVYGELSAEENLMLYAALYRLENGRSAVNQIIDRVDLKRFATQPVRTYSRGQLQRLGIARTLLHAPRVVLFDEPTTGLDALSTARFTSLIAEEKERGALIVIVSHDAPWLNALSDIRILIEHGRIFKEAKP